MSDQEVPKGWRSVQELIKEGYEPAPTDFPHSQSHLSKLSDFNYRVSRFAEDAAFGIMQAGSKAMMEWEGSDQQALERTVSRTLADAHVRDHLVAEIGDDFYLSPDAVSSLEMTSSIAKKWVDRPSIRDSRPANVGDEKPQKPTGRSPG